MPAVAAEWVAQPRGEPSRAASTLESVAAAEKIKRPGERPSLPFVRIARWPVGTVARDGQWGVVNRESHSTRVPAPLRSLITDHRPLTTDSPPAIISLMSTPDQSPAFIDDATLLPAIVQDAATGQVLMLAYMNREAYAETLRTGKAVFFSRSKGRLWRKGEESGNEQLVRQLLLDCDRDTILLRVEQLGGAACHQGYASCFFRQVTPTGLEIIAEKVFDPVAVYGREGH